MSGYPQRNSQLSSSLRRPRNKDREDGPRSFQRSGTGGTLDRRGGVNRSHSVAGNREEEKKESRWGDPAQFFSEIVVVENLKAPCKIFAVFF